jgi:hypothetical protein
MPFGFGSSKKKNTELFTRNIIDREEISEITKIAEMLNPDKKSLTSCKTVQNKTWRILHDTKYCTCSEFNYYEYYFWSL